MLLRQILLAGEITKANMIWFASKPYPFLWKSKQNIVWRIFNKKHILLLPHGEFSDPHIFHSELRPLVGLDSLCKEVVTREMLIKVRRAQQGVGGGSNEEI